MWTYDCMEMAVVQAWERGRSGVVRRRRRLRRKGERERGERGEKLCI